MRNNLNRGVIVIIAFLMLLVLLILGTYFLNFILTELRISRSQEVAAKTYYLAEAGIDEAIWKLKNDGITLDGDPAWKNDFIDASKNPDGNGNYWSASFSRSDLTSNGSYTVTIQNSAVARGQIISIARFNLAGGKIAQRVVKVSVFKATGSQTGNSSFFSGGTSENIDIQGSKIRINGGNVFCNNNLNIKWWSEVEVYDNPETEVLEGRVLAVNNLNVTSSILDIWEAKCAKNACTQRCDDYVEGKTGCPPAPVSMLVIDFSSTDNPNSFKNRAQNAQNLGQCSILCNGISCSNKCVLTSSEFDDLLWQVNQNGILTLNNEITYVTGPIELRGGRRVIVNGILASGGTVDIGVRYSWTKQGKKDEGFSQITINEVNERASGLLTKAKINLGLYCSFQDIDITGVLYATDEISLISVPNSFNLLGGMLGRKLDITSCWQWLNITLDNDRINRLLNLSLPPSGQSPVEYSPVVTIEHWEETY